mmetsp:Transcript_60905/g.68995  ORF Transcript_60905/g.68995 Transcript_60905/m.68995 type:complete len:181 (-) Transcript_60905:335-877(-)|eukprot:CAMPEP_0170944650 /NCGR_PEP_ID=MMETSP0735-20130129/25878_1 /TAXON_ID=186038 /ORGANISM="Fragilariopsis kerguelensis, Strain L26-C5" /LENGTH=180 /DNA_ID=CAMNT_0011352707 /DNA_START=448 /DNA_END=990 /DNA_ORIENTATION=-
MTDLLDPMDQLNYYDEWREAGEKVVGREIPKCQDLIQAKGFLKFLSLSDIGGTDGQAMKSKRPSSATLILGALYSNLVRYHGNTDNEPSYTLAPYDIFNCSWKSMDPSLNNEGTGRLTYFLMALYQGQTLEVDLEYVKFTDMDITAAAIASLARIQFSGYSYHQLLKPTVNATFEAGVQQ